MRKGKQPCWLLLPSFSSFVISMGPCFLDEVSFLAPGCILNLWRVCYPPSYAFRVPQSTSLPFKSPPRPCELPPSSSCLRVCHARPSLSPDLLRW